MDLSILYGLILYNGFVNERNKILRRSKFSLFSKKKLGTQFYLWKKIIISLKSGDYNYEIIEEFHSLCNRSPEFRKNHVYSYQIVNKLIQNDYKSDIKSKENVDNSEIIIVNKLLVELITELIDILEKSSFFISKMELYHTINILHNLPRIYLFSGEDILDSHMKIYSRIEPCDAITYSLLSMSVDRRNKSKRQINPIFKECKKYAITQVK